MAHETQAAPGAVAPAAEQGEHGGGRLGPLLCWAVVFADIGTSVYYVPGILYAQVGRLAGLFVVMTLFVFLLLTLKYAEVSVRFPEGGGVVTVAARGLNPWAGAVGGMFILVDYFLTSAISSLSGIQYFGTVIPALRGPLTALVVTLVVVALLGVLNWYGVKESATVSLYIAIAAFVSDIAILLAVFLTVPLHTIADTFREIFQGRHLTGGVLLTGFAGAFLAFSGLESISQLSPVMRVPRKKTVTVALTLVVITVGVTSPLLTIFSTTLLDAAHTDPTVFISKLAGFSGGPVLEILTAVTASTLLIFASNTAIIGAYHVFLALSRMQFFPKVVERTNKLRGTPHVSIFLATVIPMAVLVAVAGNINILGDMYAFGLLGAFSLTCVALDVIRYRERHGGEHIGETGEHEEREAAARRNLRSAHTVPFLEERLDPAAMERLWHLRQGMRVRREVLARQTAPVTRGLRAAWPSIRYYLGFLTTALVVLAWAVNLKSKPLATAFGGGLTLLGVGISVIHYRYQQARGERPVFLMSGLRRMPNSILVVLSPRSAHNLEVARAALESAEGRTVVFLYIGEPEMRDVRAFAFNDPYLYDEQAQRTLMQINNLAAREHVPVQFMYRVAGSFGVLEAWRALHPSEIIAEADIAKALSKRVAPEYVRFQQLDGVRVAHYVKHHPDDDGVRPPPGSAFAPARGTRGGPADRAAPLRSREASRRPAEWRAPDERREPEHHEPEAAPRPPASERDELAAELASQPVDIDDYVWTGTELVRRSELERRAEGGGEDAAGGPDRDPRS